MQVSSINLTLLISILSLTISVGTFYWNILRPAKFTSPPIRWIAFLNAPVEEGGYTIITLPVFVTNIGGKAGVIDSFRIDLIQLHPQEREEKFYANQEGNILKNLLEGRNIPELEIPPPVALKPAETLVNYYSFVPDSLDYKIAVGDYRLILSVYVGQRHRKISEQRLKVLEVIQPTILQGIVSYLFSYNLLPKKVIEVKDYKKVRVG